MRDVVKVALLAACGCGGGAADLNLSQPAVVAYNAEVDAVWKAMADEMHYRYRDIGIAEENREKGTIVSNWESVKSVQVQARDPRPEEMARMTTSNTVVRIEVRLLPGGPPWKVAVAGEAAERNGGSVRVLKNPSYEEMKLVAGKMDGVTTGIHRHLRDFAVEMPGER